MTDQEADLFNKLVAGMCWIRRAMNAYRPKMELMPVEGNRALAEASMAIEDALRMMKER